MVLNRKIKPDFLIIGPPKSGTTSLYHILNKHPEIQMSSIKEPHYFSDLDYKDAINSDDEYSELYAGVGENQIGGEASTSYFPFYNKAIHNISRRIGVDVSIIIILREPCQRAFSHYQYYKKLGREFRDFSQVISDGYIVREEPWGEVINPYIEFSFYFDAVEAYINTFKNIHFIYLEDLEGGYAQTIRKLLAFLDVDQSYIPENEVRNVSGELKIKFFKNIINNPFMYKNVISRIPYKVKVKLRKLLLKREQIAPKELRMLNSLYNDDYQKTKKIIEDIRNSSKI